MFYAHLSVTIVATVTAAVAIAGWRKARRQVKQFRALYWSLQRALREETRRDG